MCRRLFGKTKDKESKEALKGICFDLLKCEPDKKRGRRDWKSVEFTCGLGDGLCFEGATVRIVGMGGWRVGISMFDWIVDAEWLEIPEIKTFAKAL